MNPGVSGTLTLLQEVWSCGGGSYLLSDGGQEGRVMSELGVGRRRLGWTQLDPGGRRLQDLRDVGLRL